MGRGCHYQVSTDPLKGIRKAMHIIHHKGIVQKATLPNGTVVSREDSLFVPEWVAFVACAPYDNHFIYLNPDTQTEGSAYLCTCGSVAVVVPPGPEGMFVCHFDATYGFHQTTVINTKDRDSYRGKTVEIVKGRAKVR